MKFFIIALVLAVACVAAPSEEGKACVFDSHCSYIFSNSRYNSFSVDSYERLEDLLKTVLQKDNRYFGNLQKIVATILNCVVKKNPMPHQLAKRFAPEQPKELADGIKRPQAGASDEKELMLLLNKLNLYHRIVSTDIVFIAPANLIIG